MSTETLDDLMPPRTAKPLADASARIRKAARPAKQPKGWKTFEQWIKPLKWLDGRPLAEWIEPYRMNIFSTVLDTFDAERRVKYTMALAGRGKKNAKSSDLVLAALFALTANDAPNGNQCYLVANDADQARDDLTIAKLILKKNPILADLVTVRKNIIERNDGAGFLEVLPKGDVAGAHGKTYRFLGFDEIHSFESHDIFEALALDPTRKDSQVFVTSYASLKHQPGIPLYDFMETAKAGTDPRMFFSWYGADFCTDPALADATPEQRANPSMGGTFDPEYLESQRRRLPAVRFNRLHLNLPGLPEGSAFTLESVMAAVDKGVTIREPERYVKAFAAVDMSGGSSDDAVLAIAHEDPERKGYVVLDLVMNQGRVPPFDPNQPVKKWAPILDAWGIKTVHGDAYAGEVFAAQFRDNGFTYQKQKDLSASDLYEAFEVVLNAGKVRLLDVPKLHQELLGLAWRGQKIDHPPGQHDDWANAVAAVVNVICSKHKSFTLPAWSVTQSTTGELTFKDGAQDTETIRKPASMAISDRGPWVHPHDRGEALTSERDLKLGTDKADRWRNAWGVKRPRGV